MNTIKIKINQREIEVDSTLTVLQAAKQAGFQVPTLCYLKDVNQSGACRMCVVEVKGARSLVTACNYPLTENMEIFTHSKRALDSRRKTIELILSNHCKDCLYCIRNQNCELQTLAQELNVRQSVFEGAFTPASIDIVADGIVRDTSKCILCGRCVEMCKTTQGLGILNYIGRGFKTKIGPVCDYSFNEVNCMQCGQCINVCPVGALSEKEEIHNVIAALNNPSKTVIVQTAPAVRASLGEEFGMPIGTGVTGKMVAALRRIGFKRVYDTNYAADLTIMEEGTEFIHRVQTNGTLPLITSCSPGWIRYMEFEYPDLIKNVSSCKSPHMMFGAILKSYYAQSKNIDPKDIYVVSIMPCIAKKEEKKRLNKHSKIQDVDAVLTTRELGKMIKLYGIDFKSLPNEEFDQDMFGEYTGASVIFGTSGGVMEAALRTVTEILTKKTLEDVNFVALRGVEGVKEASLDINGQIIRVAVAHSMRLAKPLLDDIRKNQSPYAFIEIMGCPGGCINGGGQSIVNANIRNTIGKSYMRLRADVLYAEDKTRTHRKSHENQQIKDLYTNFLEEPGSHIAHELLHTHYSAKRRFKPVE
ncbi:MAG: NADH-dependent [FeFe] hydrogenase, group A6 [Erysipelotrichaceae bacterium]